MDNNQGISLKVGSIVINTKPVLDNPIGTHGVVYEVYELFIGKAKKISGVSVIFANGKYDGFSTEEQQSMLWHVGDEKKYENYQFQSVVRVSQDFQAGHWNFQELKSKYVVQTVSQEQVDAMKQNAERWDRLTAQQKQDIRLKIESAIKNQPALKDTVETVGDHPLFNQWLGINIVASLKNEQKDPRLEENFFINVSASYKLIPAPLESEWKYDINLAIQKIEFISSDEFLDTVSMNSKMAEKGFYVESNITKPQNPEANE